MKENIKKTEPLPYVELDYSKLNGIVPASILDSKTGLYLMTGYMNKEAYKWTLGFGEVVFWSRSTKGLWHKGGTSGNRLIVKDIKPGCENDILSISVDPTGPVCHRDTWTCFDDISLKGLSREERFKENSRCPYCGK